MMNSPRHVHFYAGSLESYAALRPIFEKVPREYRGTFFVGQGLPIHDDGIERLHRRLLDFRFIAVVTASPRDFLRAFYAVGGVRPFVLVHPGQYVSSNALIDKEVGLHLSKKRKDSDPDKVKTYKTPSQAVSLILEFFESIELIALNIDPDAGVVYMGFGRRALESIEKSVESMRVLGLNYPITVVGDTPTSSFDFIQWGGVSPFDWSQPKMFRFRAGRVKPGLAKLSPYKKTLYVDADTVFLKNIDSAFRRLDKVDACVTQEYLTLNRLYNQAGAAWTLSIEERNQTIKELKSDGNIPFINSGVIFFKNNSRVLKLFDNWRDEWARFQQWDEQLALMRAMHRSDAVVEQLPPTWNCPRLRDDAYIFHNYGKGVVRTNE